MEVGRRNRNLVKCLWEPLGSSEEQRYEFEAKRGFAHIGGTHYSLNRPAQASLTRSLQVEELNLERRLDRLPDFRRL